MKPLSHSELESLIDGTHELLSFDAETSKVTRSNMIIRLLAQIVLNTQPADVNMPKECREKKCAYYAHYLAYGGPDLTHEGYHAAEKNATAHMENCTRSNSGKECPVCFSHEQRIRA